MKTELITQTLTQTLVKRLQADGMQIGQVMQSEKDGNLEITIQAHALGLKSLTVKMEEVEVSRPFIEDFNLLGEDEGFVDHIDYSPDSPRKLVLSADDEI